MTIAHSPEEPAPLDLAFAALLCCPVCDCRPPLRVTGATLVCDVCGRAFPIRDGLPDLRPESGILPGRAPKRDSTAV
jgi:uncharacterized protein YbaR (Trm112 family)